MVVRPAGRAAAPPSRSATTPSSGSSSCSRARSRSWPTATPTDRLAVGRLGARSRPGWPTGWTDPSPDLELLEVAAAGRLHDRRGAGSMISAATAPRRRLHRQGVRQLRRARCGRGRRSSAPSSCCSSPTCCSSTARRTTSASRRRPSSPAVWITIGLSLHVRDAGLAGRHRGRRVPLRLPDREEPLGRQRVRLGGDLQLLRRARTKYQFRVLFWGIFGALVLRAHLHLRRRRAARDVRLDPLRLRRVPARSPPSGSPGTRTPRSTPRRTRCSSSCAGSCRRPTSTTGRSCSPAAPASCWPPRCSPC